MNRKIANIKSSEACTEKYQKLIKTVDHEQYEVLFNDANLKNPNYEEFKNFVRM